jgi:hypothetical protein
VCFVFVRFGKVNASVTVSVLITVQCVSLDFSTVQQNSPIRVSDSFLVLVWSNSMLCRPLVTTAWNVLRLRLEEPGR